MIDENIRTTSTEIFNLNETLLELSNKKILMTERNKYDKESNQVKTNLINLKDKQGTIENNILSIKSEINNLKESSESLKNKLFNYTNEYNELNKQIDSSNFNINSNIKLLNETTNKIDILKENISSMNKVPFSVKNIVGNPTLRGIHNILANVINTKEEYATMIDVSLGASANNIITDDENTAKEAIEYLKRRNLGRATFFPLNVIKPKSVDPETNRIISSMLGFIGVASDLVTYDSKYYNIIMNQLGNIIVANDINSAISISKKINHRYRVVSLDGEIIHVGGIMTGGSNKTSSSYISDKYELDKLELSIENINNTLSELENKRKELDNDFNIIKDNIYNTNIEIVKTNETINNKEEVLSSLEKELSDVEQEISNLNDNSLDKELDKIINEYYVHEQKRISLEKSLELFNKEKTDLNGTLIDLEASIKKQNSEFNRLTNEINNLEISITKINMNLDSLLTRLSEDYSLGYEKAKNDYILEINEKDAREKVTTLRRKIKSLGDVNLGSIEEYERINKRVTFLSKQKDDLEKSENDLLTIIKDMDYVMIDKFKDTFDKINVEFSKVFKTLFKGGNAHLELTDPTNILETGIDIIAIPPGKNEKPLSLLSGGERTLTAISLLFAIMNLEHVPFVILDEVESALDENNAIIFGEYLNNYKNKTQLLIITHKKKTMEFLDRLYGVTMQESGVSKLVSVKLEN